jgi:hypothetical protein
MTNTIQYNTIYKTIYKYLGYRFFSDHCRRTDCKSSGKYPKGNYRVGPENAAISRLECKSYHSHSEWFRSYDSN